MKFQLQNQIIREKKTFKIKFTVWKSIIKNDHDICGKVNNFFRQINAFTKEVFKELISRKIVFCCCTLWKNKKFSLTKKYFVKSTLHCVKLASGPKIFFDRFGLPF